MRVTYSANLVTVCEPTRLLVLPLQESDLNSKGVEKGFKLQQMGIENHVS